MSAIYSLLDEVQAFPHRSPEYVEKMMHRIPAATVVDRVPFILEQCADRIVLNLGSASGTLHEGISKVARHVVGVDRESATICCDLDREPGRLATLTGVVDLIVAGEILEHLANPGRLLEVLRALNANLLVTVPNAFSRAGNIHALNSYENVNLDHVAWYSYTTLKTLLTRYGFEVTRFHWYEGQPLTAEGLVFVAR